MGKKSKVKSGKTKGLNTVEKKEVNRMIHKTIETKQQLILGNDYTTYSGGLSVLTSVPQQTTVANDSTRIGNKIEPVSIDIRGQIKSHLTGSNTVRLILLKWKPDTEADLPGVTSILNTTYVETSNAPFAPFTFNRLNRKKFTVLSDRTHFLDFDQDPVHNFHIHKKLSGFQSYNDAGVLGNNKIYLLYIGDIVVTGSKGEINYVSNFWFKDA